MNDMGGRLSWGRPIRAPRETNGIMLCGASTFERFCYRIVFLLPKCHRSSILETTPL